MDRKYRSVWVFFTVATILISNQHSYQTHIRRSVFWLLALYHYQTCISLVSNFAHTLECIWLLALYQTCIRLFTYAGVCFVFKFCIRPPRGAGGVSGSSGRTTTVKYICSPDCKMYLSKLQNTFVPIYLSKLNIYMSKFIDIFALITGYIHPNR